MGGSTTTVDPGGRAASAWDNLLGYQKNANAALTSAYNNYSAYDPVTAFYNSAPQAQALSQQTFDPYQAAARTFALTEADRAREATLGSAASYGARFSSAAARNSSTAAQQVLQGNEANLAQQKAAMDMNLYGVNQQNNQLDLQRLSQIYVQAMADRANAYNTGTQWGANNEYTYYNPGLMDYLVQGAGVASNVASVLSQLPVSTIMQALQQKPPAVAGGQAGANVGTSSTGAGVSG